MNWLSILCKSHLKLLGVPLHAAGLGPEAAADWLHEEADFCLLAHDASADPCFVYANLAALRCFGFAAAEFIGMPSRLSAEAPRREEREALLAEVARKGFATGYRGLRVARDGRRFWIEDVTVWNLVDDAGQRVGQAASYRRITPAQG